MDWRGRAMAGGNRSTIGSVEVTRLDDGSVALRDLTNRTGPGVVFSGQEWAEFLRGVRSNRFDFGPGPGAGPNPGPRPGVDVESTVRLKV